MLIIQEGDITVLGVHNTSAWEVAVSPKPPLTGPHMLAPAVPPMANNRRLQDAVRAVKAVCNGLMVNVMVKILPPQARYMAAPCCKDHMGNWSATLLPSILIESLLNID